MIGTIDFIVSFIGENSGVLSQPFFKTIKQYCDLTSVIFHLVRKQVSDKVWLEVVESVKQLSCHVIFYDLDTGWHPYRGAIDSFSFDKSDSVNFEDSAKTAEWCVEHCGEAEWCILSHFDVIWKADILDWLKKKQSETGAMMVGSHCPIMLLNRNAYRSSGVSFDPGYDTNGASYDVGVALSRDLNAVNFVSHDVMSGYFIHLGGGGGYHTVKEFQSMRDRANHYNFLTDNKYGKIMNQILPTGQSITLIHYVFQDVPERVACMPNMTEFGKTRYHDVVLRSNATPAVTCPACKKTNYYKNPMVKYG